MKSFTYDALPGRVIFGPGASRQRLAEEVDRLGARRLLLIATERERERAQAWLRRNVSVLASDNVGFERLLTTMPRLRSSPLIRSVPTTSFGPGRDTSPADASARPYEA